MLLFSLVIPIFDHFLPELRNTQEIVYCNMTEYILKVMLLEYKNYDVIIFATSNLGIL